MRPLSAIFPLGLFLLAAVPGSAALAASNSYVYVETNTKPVNAIRAFNRNPVSGQLTELPGSPFLTGGAGSGYSGIAAGPDDSDQEIVQSADHTLLFAINAGSDSIAVLRVGSNGALTPIAGSPFGSGGSDPVSLDIAGNLLFVANKAGDPARPTTELPNYTTLRIQSNGSLVPSGDVTNSSSSLLNSTISVATGSPPEQIHVIPGTGIVYGDDFLGNLIQRFVFASDGGLHQFPPLALPASLFADTTTPRVPQGFWHHPTQPLLYVGVPLSNKLLVYQRDGLGGLTFLRAVANQGQGICWIRSNQAGTRLYTSDTITNSIGVYDLSDPENPVQIQELTLVGPGTAFQISLSADEKSLYVLSPRTSDTTPLGQGNLLHSLTVGANGTLSETLAPIAFPSASNARPRGIVAVPAS